MIPQVVEITDRRLAKARAFLEHTPETSFLLLSNLSAFGPRLGDSLASGDFRGISWLWKKGVLERSARDCG